MGDRKSFLISFSGIDGSGKTTLSKSLVEMLNKNGIKCRYVYGRLQPLLSKPFMWLGRIVFLRKTSKNYVEYSRRKRETMKKFALLSLVYKYILLLDYSLQLLFKIRIPKLLGKSIVCDRYVYDTVINDISADHGLSIHEMKKVIDKLFYFAIRPDIAFLIDLPEEIAYQRKSDTPSLEYLRERRKLYLEIAREFRIVVLEGTKELDELLKEIVGKTKKNLKILPLRSE